MLFLRVAAKAMGETPRALHTCTGDIDTKHKIYRSAALPREAVSPTQGLVASHMLPLLDLQATNRLPSEPSPLSCA